MYNLIGYFLILSGIKEGVEAHQPASQHSIQAPHHLFRRRLSEQRVQSHLDPIPTQQIIPGRRVHRHRPFTGEKKEPQQLLVYGSIPAYVSHIVTACESSRVLSQEVQIQPHFDETMAGLGLPPFKRATGVIIPAHMIYKGMERRIQSDVGKVAANKGGLFPEQGVIGSIAQGLEHCQGWPGCVVSLGTMQDIAIPRGISLRERRPDRVKKGVRHNGTQVVATGKISQNGTQARSRKIRGKTRGLARAQDMRYFLAHE